MANLDGEEKSSEAQEVSREPNPDVEPRVVVAKPIMQYIWYEADEVGNEKLLTPAQRHAIRNKRSELSVPIEVVNGELDYLSALHPYLPLPLRNTLVERVFHCNTNVERFGRWLIDATGGRSDGTGGQGRAYLVEGGQLVVFFASVVRNAPYLVTYGMRGRFISETGDGYPFVGNLMSFSVMSLSDTRIQVRAVCVSVDLIDYFYELLDKVADCWPESGLLASNPSTERVVAPTSEGSNYTTVFNVSTWNGGVTVGDSIKTGDNINIGGNQNVGKFGNVISNLNSAGQAELANALAQLKEAILASDELSDDKKQEQVEAVTVIAEEAAKPTPNKTVLKGVFEALLSTAKAIPDIAKVAATVGPLLDKLL